MFCWASYQDRTFQTAAKDEICSCASACASSRRVCCSSQDLCEALKHLWPVTGTNWSRPSIVRQDPCEDSWFHVCPGSKGNGALAEPLGSFIYSFFMWNFILKCVFIKLLIIIYTPELIKLDIRCGLCLDVFYCYSVQCLEILHVLCYLNHTYLYCLWIYLQTLQVCVVNVRNLSVGTRRNSPQCLNPVLLRLWVNASLTSSW